MRPYSALILFFLVFSSATPQVHSHEIALKVGTLNSWMIPFLRKYPLERANIIGSGLGKKGYDLVLLQEMFSPWYLKITRNRYFEARPSLTGPPRIPLINSGLALLTHGRLIKKDFEEFTRCSGFQCLAAKGMQFRRVELEGAIIDVYNVHFQPFQKESSIRESQLKDLKRFIKKNSDKGHPVILGGDFNIIAESREYLTLVSELEGFTDVWNEARPDDPGHSWNPRTNPYAKPDPEEDYIEQRVDYLFVRDGEDLKWKILGANLEFTSPKKLGFGRYFGSDHFGVGAQIMLSPR